MNDNVTFKLTVLTTTYQSMNQFTTSLDNSLGPRVIHQSISTITKNSQDPLGLNITTLSSGTAKPMHKYIYFQQEFSDKRSSSLGWNQQSSSVYFTWCQMRQTASHFGKFLNTQGIFLSYISKPYSHTCLSSYYPITYNLGFCQFINAPGPTTCRMTSCMKPSGTSQQANSITNNPPIWFLKLIAGLAKELL